MANIQVLHAPVHTREQVEEILREAGRITGELEPVLPLVEETFRQAVTLLAARVSVPIMPEQVPVDLGALRGLNGVG